MESTISVTRLATSVTSVGFSGRFKSGSWLLSCSRTSVISVRAGRTLAIWGKMVKDLSREFYARFTREVRPGVTRKISDDEHGLRLNTYDLVQDSLEGVGERKLGELSVRDDSDFPLLDGGGGAGKGSEEGEDKGDRLEKLHCARDVALARKGRVW
jgi:hypothetical protein